VANGDGRLGITTAGQRTSEAVGGSGERGEAIRHTRDLFLRRLLEVAFLALWVPLIAGPWCLAVYVPIAFDRFVNRAGVWLGLAGDRTRAEEYVYRASLLCVGIAVALGLLVLPGWALAWWPWRWQASAESWRGLLWPRWWMAAVPSFVLIRAVLVVGPWRASREIWYLDQRQRQEIIAPTLSGVAYTSPEAHRVSIPGIHNPHRDPNAPSAPPSEVRAIFRMVDDGGNGHGTTRIVNCPDDVATLEQLRDLANLALDYDVRPTRAQIVTKRHLFTDAAWRAFQAWMLEQGLVTKSSTSQNAPYELTRDGHQWLRTIQEGQAEQAF
jgi:hypothetical protein